MYGECQVRKRGLKEALWLPKARMPPLVAAAEGGYVL